MSNSSWVKSAKAYGVILGIFLALLLFASAVLMFILGFEVEEVTIIRSTSPNQKWEAIVVQVDAGATVSTGYSVRLRKAGATHPTYEVTRIDKVPEPEKISLNWRAEKLVVTLPEVHQIYRRSYSAWVDGSAVEVDFKTAKN